MQLALTWQPVQVPVSSTSHTGRPGEVQSSSREQAGADGSTMQVRAGPN